jgi:flagellar motility protein MotE (MotC chaperone)
MKRAGRGALVILALFLASSGALRIGGLAGEAMANANADVGEAAAPEPIECPAPPPALLQALKDREAQVRAQEAAAADRMAALTLAEAAIAKRMEELTAAEASLKEVLAIADGAAEEDLARLTSVYEAMKATDAAALFDAMAPEFAAGFLGRMQPAAAAAVMAGMSPDKAYAISVLIAGRNALAPKQ